MSYCFEVYSVSIMTFLNIVNGIILYYGIHFFNTYDMEVIKYHSIHPYVIYAIVLSTVYIFMSVIMLAFYILIKEKQRYQGSDNSRYQNINQRTVITEISAFENKYLLDSDNAITIVRDRKVRNYMMTIIFLIVLYVLIDIGDFSYSLYYFNNMNSTISNYYQDEYKHYWIYFSNRVYYIIGLTTFLTIHGVLYYICR